MPQNKHNCRKSMRTGELGYNYGPDIDMNFVTSTRDSVVPLIGETRLGFLGLEGIFSPPGIHEFIGWKRPSLPT